MKRRDFLIGGTLAAVAIAIPACATQRSLDEVLELSGATIGTAHHNEEQRKVVIGWDGKFLLFPEGRRLSSNEKIFLIKLNDDYVEQFLKDVLVAPGSVVDVRLEKYVEQLNPMHNAW